MLILETTPLANSIKENKIKNQPLPIVLTLPHPTYLKVAKMAQNGATDPNTANNQAGAPEFAKGKGKAVEEHEDTSMVEDDDDEEEDEEVEEVISSTLIVEPPAFPLTQPTIKF